jgi:hypothetical protein
VKPIELPKPPKDYRDISTSDGVGYVFFIIVFWFGKKILWLFFILYLFSMFFK